MAIRQLGDWAQIIGTAAEIGSKYIGGSGGGNVAKQFTQQVGTGKTYMQGEADAYRATAKQYGLDPVQLAKAEYSLGRPLTVQELQTLSGSVQAPATGATPGTAATATQYGQALTEQAAPKSKALPWLIGLGLAYKFLF